MIAQPARSALSQTAHDVRSVGSELQERHEETPRGGSGNHFVEFGRLTVLDDTLGLPRSDYLELLSRSGSRGNGTQVARHYSRLAQRFQPELPTELSNLVEPLARFEPRLVKMAPSGEPPEDRPVGQALPEG